MAQGGILDNGLQSFDQGGWLQPGMTLAHNGTGVPERVISFAEGGLRGDTFYGDPGGRRAKRERFSDEEGAQFDYMNRRETRARRHEPLTYGTPRAKDGLRVPYYDDVLDASRAAERSFAAMSQAGFADGRGATQPAPVMPVPTGGTTDNSVTVSVGAGAVRVDVRAEVGAEPSGMRRNVATAVEQALAAFQASLYAEIRARR